MGFNRYLISSHPFFFYYYYSNEKRDYNVFFIFDLNGSENERLKVKMRDQLRMLLSTR